MIPLDEFPAPFDKEKHMEPFGKEYQEFSHAQWKGAHQQADNIDLFHEAEMEAGTPLSPGGASADSLEFVSSPHFRSMMTLSCNRKSRHQIAPMNGMEVLLSADGVEV
jgi:hypothetical protein